MSEEIKARLGVKDLSDMNSEDWDRHQSSPGFDAEMREQERKWQEFVATASDEEIVRAYLSSRVLLWQQLPYDWMEMDIEELDAANLIDYPPEVEAAYKRSRANPNQRAMFASDYERGQDLMDKYHIWLCQRHGLDPSTGEPFAT
jgi:hypothetical protein